MMSPWKSALLCGSAALAFSAAAIAQTVPPSPAGTAPPPAMGQAPFYDPQQLPAYRGQVQQLTLTPRGDIDGLILSDGTEVKTPPHLSTQLAYSVKPGDTVTVHGLRAAALPLVQAVSITDEASGQTVIDNGPPGPKTWPGRAAAGLGAGRLRRRSAAPMPGLTEAQGRVRMTLHGRQGEVNGALLDDGTILRLPPPEAYRFAALLQPGQTVVAEGVGFANAIGKVLEVWQIGASRDQLSQVQVPPGPGPGGKKGRRGPPPAFAGLAPPPPPRHRALRLQHRRDSNYGGGCYAPPFLISSKGDSTCSWLDPNHLPEIDGRGVSE